MKLNYHLVVAALTCLLCCRAGRTQEKPAMLIEPSQLEKKLKSLRLRIIDVRSKEDYAQSHIPGAIRVDLSDWKSLAVAERGLHDSSGWAKRLTALGISPKTQVIVYGDRVSNSARIWWLLKYTGVENVGLLNGGWEVWQGEKRQTTSAVPKVIANQFKPRFQADRLAEFDSVKKSIKARSVKLVDTRSDGEFDNGRVPGSVHLEWKHLLAKDGRFKSPDDLNAVFKEKGIVPAHTAVCY